jgi:hypothetical protein
VSMVWRIFGWIVHFVFVEIVFGDHLDIGIVGVDVDWSAQRHSNRAISSEQCPPYPLPEAFVGSAELRALDTSNMVRQTYRFVDGKSLPSVHS